MSKGWGELLNYHAAEALEVFTDLLDLLNNINDMQYQDVRDESKYLLTFSTPDKVNYYHFTDADISFGQRGNIKNWRDDGKGRIIFTYLYSSVIGDLADKSVDISFPKVWLDREYTSTVIEAYEDYLYHIIQEEREEAKLINKAPAIEKLNSIKEAKEREQLKKLIKKYGVPND